MNNVGKLNYLNCLNYSRIAMRSETGEAVRECNSFKASLSLIVRNPWFNTIKRIRKIGQFNSFTSILSNVNEGRKKSKKENPVWLKKHYNSMSVIQTRLIIILTSTKETKLYDALTKTKSRLFFGAEIQKNFHGSAHNFAINALRKGLVEQYRGKE